MLEDLDVARAVHGLDGVEPLVRGLGEIHVLAELLHVARLPPELRVHELRGAHLLVPGGGLPLAHVPNERLEHGPAPRMPEHRARRLLLQVKQVEVLADAAVIALLRFLEPLQVLLELLLVRPGGAVDPLQHLVARIATPVSPRHLGELEGLELARRRHVRSAAQVDPVALPVEADLFLAGNSSDDLRLVELAQALEVLHGLIARHDAPRDLLVGSRELGHLRFDGGEILRREGPLVGKVVIEPILDDRSDGHLGVGKELLDRLRQEMGRRVANDVEALGIPVGHDRERGIVGNHVGSVDQLAVDAPGERRLAQPRPDRGRHLVHRHRVVEAALSAVGQSDNGHGLIQCRCKIKRALRSCFLRERPLQYLVGASGIEPPTTTMSR